MSRIIRFVLMVQFLIFVTMAAQTPAAASGGPVCQDVMCAVGSHCDQYADCEDPYGTYPVCARGSSITMQAGVEPLLLVILLLGYRTGRSRRNTEFSRES